MCPDGTTWRIRTLNQNCLLCREFGRGTRQSFGQINDKAICNEILRPAVKGRSGGVVGALDAAGNGPENISIILIHYAAGLGVGVYAFAFQIVGGAVLA